MQSRPPPEVLLVRDGRHLLVPMIGSFYPVPPFPVDFFPYVSLGYMALGSTWIYVVSRRERGIFSEIETQLESSMQASAERHAEEVGTIIPIDKPFPAFVPAGLMAEGEAISV